MPSFRRNNPITTYKLLSAALVLSFYLLYLLIHGPTYLVTEDESRVRIAGPEIQHRPWTGSKGRPDEVKMQKVVEAMKHTFWNYRKHAWGYDDILPVSGKGANSRNGWGAFIVDSANTLALMGLWDELKLSVDRIIQINFHDTKEQVDPFETTIRYVGGLVSLVELIDNGVVPSTVVDEEQRNKILAQAQALADELGPAFDSPTGMLWPRVDFAKGKGTVPRSQATKEDRTKPVLYSPSIGPARAGSNILEYRVLSSLTGSKTYFQNATQAWTPLVWGKYKQDPVGLIDAPIDIKTGAPTGRDRHWDGGHDSYYEYLLKKTILDPRDKKTKAYTNTWLAAASALRHSLATRSSPSANHPIQHLFLGKLDGNHYLNEMSHLAHFAPGNLLLGGAYLNRTDLIHLGQALLEASHHTYASSPSGIGPEAWAWLPMTPGGADVMTSKKSKSSSTPPSYEPETERQQAELAARGFWTTDARYRLRPEYMESLFYAFRITGEQRYRDWAWDAFVAIERNCRTRYGYAGIEDVGVKADAEVEEDGVKWLDESESFWAAETLKYAYLIFSEISVGNLDEWVFSTEGHLFGMIK
ncbi:glycoside hydrolase family 47 protein [Saccharata proteae CBS 121410]|uniref:alpha-1,2-Mannosidase n=1 Tax=Saccharata proteae CBS 121410 TaxID=1314787 RepID=A0A9P4I3M0_9PEZI|nr:glycoside hydrolase family 47 protein [Saccharata proteae CBS 121410]